MILTIAANHYLYFCFLVSVKRHNTDSSKRPIRSVLCPGLGTATGRMPKMQCARQVSYFVFIDVISCVIYPGVVWVLSKGDVDWQHLEYASKTCVQTHNTLTD